MIIIQSIGNRLEIDLGLLPLEQNKFSFKKALFNKSDIVLYLDKNETEIRIFFAQANEVHSVTFQAVQSVDGQSVISNSDLYEKLKVLLTT